MHEHAGSDEESDTDQKDLPANPTEHS
jgi:hypothetical protein